MKLLTEQQPVPLDGVVEATTEQHGASPPELLGQIVLAPLGKGLYEPNGGELDGPYVEDPRKTTLLVTSRYPIDVTETFSMSAGPSPRQPSSTRPKDQITATVGLSSAYSSGFSSKLTKASESTMSSTASIVGANTNVFTYTNYNGGVDQISAIAGLGSATTKVFNYINTKTPQQQLTASVTIIGGSSGV